MLAVVKTVTSRQCITNEVLSEGLPRISTTTRERRLSFSGPCWRSKTELERGVSASVVIAGGVKLKLAVWFCGNRSMVKGASEDRLAHFSVCRSGSPETVCL